jgi:rubredoxin-NAD+ reductase
MTMEPRTPVPVTSAQPAAEVSVAPLVVIGAGLAGWTTVREFRKLDTATPVVVVTADSGDFYAKPSLSNAIAQKREPHQMITTPAAKMAVTLNVTLLAFSTVQAIETESRTLTLRSPHGVQALRYGQLVLATGAQPIRAPLQGDAVERVRSVNSLDDFALFHKELQGASTVPSQDGLPKPQTVLVIGAGLIGCEFANDLVLGGHSIQVVDPSARPLASLLPEQAGLQLKDALQALGVHWHFGTTVRAVNEVPDGRLDVSLANGSVLRVDAVLSAIGLRAQTDLANAAGINCERGIVVDAQLQTSADGVYALGDGAQYASAGARTLPFVMPIMGAAKALAATLAGTPTDLVFPLMPVSIKTPALPIVVSAPHPQTGGGWVADGSGDTGAWRYLDDQGVQRGFVLTGKSAARRMELARETVLQATP